MSYVFPDAQEALFVALNGLTVTDSRASGLPGLTPAFELPLGFDRSLPVVLIEPDPGGLTGDVEDFSRVRLTVYAADLDECKGLHAGMVAVFVGEDLDVPGIGYFDEITVTSKPRVVQTGAEQYRAMATTWQLTSRPL